MATREQMAHRINWHHDLTGRKFGLWLILSGRERKPKDNVSNEFCTFLECQCDCSNVNFVHYHGLKSGKSTRCKNCANKTHGHAQKGKQTAEYKTWWSMQGRCNYPRKDGKGYCYRNGIKVCKRWLGENGYKNFYDDMGPRPSPKHSIDRINNNGDYKPSNCRWATRIEQANNTSRNIKHGFKREKVAESWM